MRVVYGYAEGIESKKRELKTKKKQILFFTKVMRRTLFMGRDNESKSRVYISSDKYGLDSVLFISFFVRKLPIFALQFGTFISPSKWSK